MSDLQNTDFFKYMLNSSEDMIFFIRIDNGYVEYINDTVVKKFGYTLDELNLLGIENIRRPIKKEDTFFEHLEHLRSHEVATDYVYITKKDGSAFPVEVNAKFVKKDGIEYNIAVARDITQRLENEKKIEDLNKNLESLVKSKTEELQKNIAFLESYKRVMDLSNIVSKSDLFGKITYVNDNFCKVSGYTKEEVLGQPHSMIRHFDTPSSIFREMWENIKSKKSWQGILKNRKKDGGYYWVDSTVMPILDEHGEIFEYIATRHDITESVKQRERLEKIAFTDALTDLGNRRKLINDIEKLKNPSIAILDIDKFSEINDFYGHNFGDTLLREVGQTIKGLIQDHSTKELYRLQADQFAILNISLKHDEFISKIWQIIAKIEHSEYLSFDEGVKVQMTASISFEKEELLISADMALKNAKRTGVDLLVYGSQYSLSGQYENNIKWTKKLRAAIASDNLVPYYQPIVNNTTLKWEKYESLVRLIDEDDKVISPFFFLEIAKNTKHYDTLTKRVINKSFETFKDSDLSFSVNLTIKDILNPQLQEYIYEMLQNHNKASQVVFEIVESEGIDNYEAVIAFIDNVKQFGCKIAIDDFGSGYSNFNYLLEFQADFIKLDGSLIRHIVTDKNARILVETIVGFAKKLNIATIAEFVENEAIFAVVKEIGIDYSQGYYFGAPAAVPNFSR